MRAPSSTGGMSRFPPSSSWSRPRRPIASAISSAPRLPRPNRAADAADLFRRAGRSALLQGDTATALPLLKQAEDLARQTAQASIVEEVARLRKAAAERASRA